MSETASATVTYTPLQSGDGESRWIRLEQVQATLPGPPLPDVADGLDRLFNVEPCDNGMGGGGEEYSEELPSADELDEMLSIVLERNGQCNQGWWLAAVNVYRTHRQPGYELRSETARVQTVRQVTESYRQVVDVDGPQIALERPYAGRLSGIPRGVNWEVRGATVNLDRPVHDRLTLRYQTWHEYVTLRVPTRETDDGEEYEAAAVVAFWGDMAAECQLEPPEPESEEEEAAKRDLCNGPKPNEPEPGDCWKTIGHYKLCECTKSRTDEWEEQASAPCDGLSAGAYVGHEEHFDGYAGGDGCDGYEPELRTPEFYKKHCCKPLPFSTSRLPGCREYYSVYRGGAAIEIGTEHWKNLYGPNVRLVAVLPESGICGDVITRWNIPNKNCCDGAEPLAPHPNNPTEIWPGRQYGIGVTGGKRVDAEFRWQASGGIVFKDNQSTSITTDGPSVWIEARENICPQPTVTVDDGCSSVVLRFSGPDTGGPSLSESDMAVMPETRFGLSASGGVPPYMWMASGGVRLLGWDQGGARAWFETGKETEWCVGEVTVVDQCGRDARCCIRNAATGRWDARREVTGDWDPCDPPGSGSPMETPGMIGWTIPRDGWRARVYTRAVNDPASCYCPPGTKIAPGRDSLFEENCRTSWVSPMGWDIVYLDYECEATNKVSGVVAHRYFCEQATNVQRWICGN